MMFWTNTILFLMFALIFRYGADLKIEFHETLTPVSVPFPESQLLFYLCMGGLILQFIPNKWLTWAGNFIKEKIKQYIERGKTTYDNFT